MAKEIERKYLVEDDSYKSMAYSSSKIIQGYLSTRKESTVRIRIRDNHAYITIKGINSGVIRDEWEYEIPVADATEMLDLCDGIVLDKTRYLVNYGDRLWEIDEFHGAHDGLVVAEIELGAENDTYPLPPFIGKEVTGDARYYNSVLSGIK